MQFYDALHNRLVFIAQQASPEFWDAHWLKNAEKTYVSPPSHRFAVWFTRRFIPEGGTVLEGGCGMGDVVHALHKAGFRAKGIDFAPKVVETIHRYWPHLDVAVGDVRKLDIESESVDGYWSLGVIEHFIDGYDDIAKEIHRVLKPGGHLLMTVPMMNRIRKHKARRGGYPRWNGSREDFYQFALDPDQVIQHFECLGFTLCYRSGQGCFDVLSEETRWFRSIERLLPSRLRTPAGVLTDMMLGRHFGHVALLALRKT